MKWEDMACFNCGDPAVTLFAGGVDDCAVVQRASCERCRPLIFEEIYRASLNG